MTTDAPLRVRVAMSHAAVQVVADHAEVDLLHVKGAALDPSLSRPGRHGSDADVMVRPDDAPRAVSALCEAGWRRVNGFEGGSPFGHAATLFHPVWGYADVHRWFPGITAPPAVAFERLWSDRHLRDIAGVGCPVPSVTAQLMLLVLNAGRSCGADRVNGDLETTWLRASDLEQARVRALVDELDAQVAFAAGSGNLSDFRHAREYALWRVLSEGGTRMEEWRARIRAAPTRRSALRLALRAPLVNVDHLAARLGREPTVVDIVTEFFARPGRGLTEELRARARHGRRS